MLFISYLPLIICSDPKNENERTLMLDKISNEYDNLFTEKQRYESSEQQITLQKYVVTNEITELGKKIVNKNNEVKGFIALFNLTHESNTFAIRELLCKISDIKLDIQKLETELNNKNSILKSLEEEHKQIKKKKATAAQKLNRLISRREYLRMYNIPLEELNKILYGQYPKQR